MTGTAADVLARCATLGEISEEPDRLTRRVATPALAKAGEVVARWMEDAGMTTRRDAVGNVASVVSDSITLDTHGALQSVG